MYGLPDDFDPQTFEGRRFSSVTFAENLISLAFDEAVIVTVLGSVMYRSSPDADDHIDTPPVSHTSLPSLVGRTVAVCKVESPQQFILDLGGGAALTFRDDSQSFESLIIRIGDQEIIV